MKTPVILIAIALLSAQMSFAEEASNSQSNRSQTQQDRSSTRSNSSSDQDRSSTQSNSSSDQDRSGSQANSSDKSSSANSQEQSGTKVSLSDVPQKVQKTLRAEAGDLNIENVRKMEKNGQSCYQATFDKGTMKGKVTVGEDGSLLQSQLAEDLALVAAVPAITPGGEKLNELPDQVKSAIKDVAGSNQVGNISKSSESGKTMYHAAFNDAGVHTDLFLDENGKVIARSDQTALFTAPIENTQTQALSSAPESVQKAVRQQASSSGQVTDIDKGTWNGQTAYRVMIDKNGSARPLIISESGTILGGQGQSSSGAPAAGESSSGQKEKSGSQDSKNQNSSQDSTQNSNQNSNSQSNSSNSSDQNSNNSNHSSDSSHSSDQK